MYVSEMEYNEMKKYNVKRNHSHKSKQIDSSSNYIRIVATMVMV